MNTAHILSGFLWALSASDGSSKPAATCEQTIEILIAGPEEARNRMDAAIRPFFCGIPDIRWTMEEKVPADRPLPASGEEARDQARQIWQIWIDVSNPHRLRVYLPATNTQGATTVRTVTAPTETDSKEVDESARQAVAQLVKTTVSSIRRAPDPKTERVAEGLVAVSPSPVAEVSSPARQTEHDHDGFFLRLLAGYGTLTATEGYEFRQYAKLGPTFNLAVGRALAPNLILYGELLVTGIVNSNDSNAYGMEENLGRDLVLWGLGPGVAYYLMPWNLYASATAGLAKITFVDASTDSPLPDTDFGYVGALTVGKEWWSGRGWGIGIAGRFSHARSMKHGELVSANRDNIFVDSDMHATAFSLSFSATYN